MAYTGKSLIIKLIKLFDSSETISSDNGSKIFSIVHTVLAGCIMVPYSVIKKTRGPGTVVHTYNPST